MEEWWKTYLSQDINAAMFSGNELELFEEYSVTEDQKRIYQIIKTGRNLPSVESEELIWIIGVVGNNNYRDMIHYRNLVEEKILKLDEAERRFKWKTGKWDTNTMKALITFWHAGCLVIDPNIKSTLGNPIQFVHEFFEHVPLLKDQTDEWKQIQQDMYVLMVKSICRSYPNATMKGIISFSDFTDFDYDRYDMDKKMRDADITSLIPNKLVRMIMVNADSKMKEMMDQFDKKVLEKYGAVLYNDYQEATKSETLLPKNLPIFIGGSFQCDILQCLKYLFRKEPEVLDFMLETYKEMETNHEIICPPHMLEISSLVL